MNSRIFSRADFFGLDFFPDLDRSFGGIAGAKRRVEFFQRRLREIDQLDLNFRLVTHVSPLRHVDNIGVRILCHECATRTPPRFGLRTAVDRRIARRNIRLKLCTHYADDSCRALSRIVSADSVQPRCRNRASSDAHDALDDAAAAGRRRSAGVALSRCGDWTFRIRSGSPPAWTRTRSRSARGSRSGFGFAEIGDDHATSAAGQSQAARVQDSRASGAD